jgi:hypothetical protein
MPRSWWYRFRCRPGVVFDKVLSNAKEPKAGDAQLIGVATEGPDTVLLDVLLPEPQVDELLRYCIAAHRPGCTSIAESPQERYLRVALAVAPGGI